MNSRLVIRLTRPSGKPFFVSPSITVILATTLALVLTACGGNATQSRTQSSASSNVHDPHGYLNDGDFDFPGDPDYDNNRDNDNDSSEDYKPDERHYYHDHDDEEIVYFGHAANASDTQAITTIVAQYYQLAAARDGRKACAMLVPSFAASVAEDYGRGSAGPTYLRHGTSCAQVLDLLFAHERAHLTAPTTVTGVRVKGTQAIALLGSTRTAASYLPVTLERTGWRIGSLLGVLLG